MARKSTKPRAKTTGKEVRASWKGNLTFGLVSFSVEAFNALNRQGSDIHFHQLHAECHSRIHYEKVCPIHGKVTNDEIVSGYEYAKGKYVEIDRDELDELRPENERGLKIDAFVSPATVDPLYFDGRMYYLLPKGTDAQEAYGVILTAMEREECCGVGRIVFSGKDQIALIRPVQGVLHMAMLNYAAEINSPEKMAAKLKKPGSASRQLKLAQSLIREWSDDSFDFSQYEDTHRDQIADLIKEKVQGKKTVEPEEKEERPATINLMEALKRSLAEKPAKSKTKSQKHSA